MITKKSFSIIIKHTLLLAICASLTGCGRDLSSNVYTSDSTLSLTLEGEIVAVRKVTIKENDKLGGNVGGTAGGGLAGAVAGAHIDNSVAGVVGGAAVGALVGTVAQGALSTQKGFEYIIKVDTSKVSSTNQYEFNQAVRNTLAAAVTSGLVTIVQSDKQPLPEGQKVYVIFSGNRTRVIPSK